MLEGADGTPARPVPGNGEAAGIALVTRPVVGRPGIYDAMLGQRRIVRSRQPLLDAARVLLGEGADPATVIEACHLGSGTVALRSTIGDAARWTLEESDRGGLRRRLWRPRPPDAFQDGPPFRAETPRNALDGVAGT